MTQALLIRDGDAATAVRLDKAPLAATAGYDEAWLRDLLFTHPELLPLDTIDPGAGSMVPICRELPLPKAGSTVFLDLFGVTAAGRPVLVECKPWRNPQARREVVGQLLEYAALLRSWSYADLTARLKAKLRCVAANPLFEAVRRSRPELDESRFVDAVSGCLARGDFDLIVAGDGIRADMHAIADFLGAAGGLMARFALVEFQVWRDATGTSVVLPLVPFRTEVVEQRVLVGADRTPLMLDGSAEDREDAVMVADPEQGAKEVDDPAWKAKLAGNRAFWERLIGTLRFTHPDQPAARHGGNNWVRVALPRPCRMVLYREEGKRVGAFVIFTGPDAETIFSCFEADQAALKDEIGEGLSFSRTSDTTKLRMNMSKAMRLLDPPTDEGQLDWLSRVGDRMVTAVRTRL